VGDVLGIFNMRIERRVPKTPKTPRTKITMMAFLCLGLEKDERLSCSSRESLNDYFGVLMFKIFAWIDLFVDAAWMPSSKWQNLSHIMSSRVLLFNYRFKYEDDSSRHLQQSETGLDNAFRLFLYFRSSVFIALIQLRKAFNQNGITRESVLIWNKSYFADSKIT